MSVLLVAGAAQAAPVTFTDRAAFDAAIAGMTATTVDFDGATALDTIADGGSFGGLTFNYSTLAGFGVTLEINDQFSTTSPNNYLGTDDGGVFQDGDDFELTFAAVNAIGIFFITADAMFDDDITLTVGGDSVGLDASAVQQTLEDGGEVFFLGIIDSANSFTSATIVADGGAGGPYFFYNVDDIVTATVPEPGTLAIFGLGLAGLGLARRRRRG